MHYIAFALIFASIYALSHTYNNMTTTNSGSPSTQTNIQQQQQGQSLRSPFDDIMQY
jgi:hypothetical protein